MLKIYKATATDNLLVKFPPALKTQMNFFPAIIIWVGRLNLDESWAVLAEAIQTVMR